MKRILLAFSLLTLFNSAHAELLEHTITVQMKRMDQMAPVKNTTNYKTTAFKTSDLIQKIGEGLGGKTFTKKARLIYQVLKTDSINDTALIIRDVDGDTEIPLSTLNVDFINHHISGNDALVTKGKYTPTAITLANIGPGKLEIAAPVLGPLLVMSGMTQHNERQVLSKEFKEQGVVLDLRNISFTGWGSHNLNTTGYPDKRVIQGSFKLSAPKVLPTPLN